MTIFNRSFFDKLIISHDRYILSHIEYQRVILTGQLCLITIIICFGYALIDLSIGHTYALPYQLSCGFLAIISFAFNRYQHFTAAKFLLGLSVNFTIFIFACNEPPEVGLYMYFIPCNLGAFVAFGNEERWKALFFIILSTLLLILVLFIKLTFIPTATFTPEYITINILINFIGAAGASVIIIYFLINIYKKSEEFLKMKEGQIEQKNKELNRFASTTSHDLRAPLNSILGIVQLMELSEDRNELSQYTGMIKEKVSDLNLFIKSIADYSRNSNQKITPTVVSVRSVIRNALENMRFSPGADRIEIKLDIPGQLEITTDAIRLQIIFNNIISNAFKYHDTSREDPFIKIQASVIQNKVSFSIEDNGIGIAKEHLSMIFDMYSRANDQSGGSGLGLFIVKEAVEKLNGSIFVESRTKSGSTFTVELPIDLNSIPTA